MEASKPEFLVQKLKCHTNDFFTHFPRNDGLSTTVYLELNFEQTVIISGHGIDENSATDHAASEALRFLKSLFTPHATVDF